MGRKQNVIVGAARVFVADSTTAIPSPVANARYGTTVAAASGWRDVGYTTNGVEVSYQPTFTDVEVDQLLDSVRTFKSAMTVTVTTTFAEATLENLLVAWAQASSTLSGSTGGTAGADGTTGLMQIASGQLGDAPLERKVIAIGNGPEVSISGFSGYSERTYAVTRAISVDTSAHTMSRTDPTTFPVSFRLLPDDNVSSAAPYGTIRDRVPPTGGWTS